MCMLTRNIMSQLWIYYNNYYVINFFNAKLTDTLIARIFYNKSCIYVSITYCVYIFYSVD